MTTEPITIRSVNEDDSSEDFTHREIIRRSYKDSSRRRLGPAPVVMIEKTGISPRSQGSEAKGMSE